MGRLDDAELVQPASRAEWRAWLSKHHDSSPGVWLVTFTKASGRQQLGYEDVVRELLCFGWVDSTTRKVDDERTALYVAPRKKGSTWAATNKARVEQLTADGSMTPAGLAVVERAKADGSWSALDAVEALQVPGDLAAAFASHPDARDAYEALRPGSKKQVLWWVVSAKRAETRASRIERLIRRADDGRPLLP